MSLESSIEKNLTMNVLIDCYGSLLTEKQRELICYYYKDDLSLSEIADNNGISRQGVYDAIKSAEIRLNEFESKVGYVKKLDSIRTTLKSLYEEVLEIEKENQSLVKSGSITDHVTNMTSIINEFIREEC